MQRRHSERTHLSPWLSKIQYPEMHDARRARVSLLCRETRQHRGQGEYGCSSAAAKIWKPKARAPVAAPSPELKSPLIARQVCRWSRRAAFPGDMEHASCQRSATERGFRRLRRARSRRAEPEAADFFLLGREGDDSPAMLRFPFRERVFVEVGVELLSMRPGPGRHGSTLSNTRVQRTPHPLISISGFVFFSVLKKVNSCWACDGKVLHCTSITGRIP